MFAMQVTPPGIRTESHPRCYLCGAEGASLYRDRIDALFAAPGVWGFLKCPGSNCGLIWLEPRPIPEDVHLAYQTYFTHGESDGPPPAGMRLRAWLYAGYLGVQALLAALLGLKKSKTQMRAMFLDDVPPGKLLDVGCGDGLFLNRMSRWGWTVDGVDFDGKAIQNAKAKYGLTLRHGDLHGAHFADATFDAITLSHVIEHVPDPINLMVEVRRILKPGGRVVLTTPNSGSWGHERFQPCWFGLDPPRHLNVFSPRTLGELARRAGLLVSKVTSTAANADIFIGGSYTIEEVGNEPKRKPQGANISLLRGCRAALAQYREHFALAKHPESGEEAVLICTKPRS